MLVCADSLPREKTMKFGEDPQDLGLVGKAAMPLLAALGACSGRRRSHCRDMMDRLPPEEMYFGCSSMECETQKGALLTVRDRKMLH